MESGGSWFRRLDGGIKVRGQRPPTQFPAAFWLPDSSARASMVESIRRAVAVLPLRLLSATRWV